MPIRNCAAPARKLVLATLLFVAASSSLAAQEPARARRNASRAQLESAAASLDQLAASTAYGERTRGRARAEATVIRRRLTEGDFRAGDRIVVRIEGIEEVLDDTATVLEGKRLPVKGFRQVALEGVLRAELETLLRNELTDYVRNATVTVRPLMRVAVFGPAVRQGYFIVPVETTIDDLLSLAGGPAADADPQNMTVQRGDTLILDTDALRAAIAQGRTINDLGLEDGDALMIPRAPPARDVSRLVQTFSFVISIVFSLTALSRR